MAAALVFWAWFKIEKQNPNHFIFLQYIYDLILIKDSTKLDQNAFLNRMGNLFKAVSSSTEGRSP